MTSQTSFFILDVNESTESSTKEVSASQWRDSNVFFRRNLFQVYNSSAKPILHNENIWFLYDKEQSLDSYRNLMLDMTKPKGIDYALDSSAGRIEFDKELEDFARRDHVSIFVYWNELGELYNKFQQLANNWRSETKLDSSLTQKFLNFNYQQIIGMGSPAISFILQDLQVAPDHWFHALRSISGENPVLQEERGDMCAMTIAWISWGKEKGLL